MEPKPDLTQYLPDLLAVGVVAWLVWKGWLKGLFIELFSLACLALALFVGLFHYDLLSRFISPYFKSAPLVALVLSVALTCFLVYKLFTVFGKKMKSALHDTPFGLFDNVAGSLFAFVKITLSIYAVYWSVSRFARPQFEHFLADHKACQVLVGVGKTEFNLVRSGVKSLIGSTKLPTVDDLTSQVPVLGDADDPVPKKNP